MKNLPLLTLTSSTSRGDCAIERMPRMGQPVAERSSVRPCSKSPLPQRAFNRVSTPSRLCGTAFQLPILKLAS